MGSSKRITTLDGLRGWAAIVVAIYHGIARPTKDAHEALLTPVQDLSEPISWLLKFLMMTFNGSLAVVIFFVLSGRVLFDSLQRATTNPLITSVDFSIKRLIRIYPVFWVALAGYVIMLKLMDINFGSNLIPSISLVLENATLTKITMYGAAWTLIVEVFAVPIILFSFFTYKKFGASALLVVASFLLMIKGLGIYPSLYIADYGFLFVLGFISSILCQREWKQTAVSEVALIILMIYGTSFVPYTHWGVSIFQGVIAFLLVTRLSELGDSPTKSFLTNPLSQFFGKISFSFYILHPIALTFFNFVGRTWFSELYLNHFVLSGILLGLLTVVFTIPLAIVSYKFVEAPSINWGKYVTKRIRIEWVQMRSVGGFINR